MSNSFPLIAIVYNPTSGNGKGIKKVERFKAFMKDKPFNVTYIQTTKESNAGQSVAQAISSKHFDSLVIIGGDGTIYEAVNGLGDMNIPVGIIPAGTGNDFIKMVSIGKTEEEQFHTAVSGKILPIDVGVCNGRKFLNGVGIGFDGEIVAGMQKKYKWLSGQAAYYYEVLKILSTYQEKEFNYQLNGKDFQNQLILLTIANGTTFGGGFKLTPEASINNGFLEVCQIEKISPLMRYLNILKLQNGTHGKLSAVNFHQATSINIAANPLLNAHIDGEFLGNPPFNISILPQFLKIRVKD